MFLNAVATAHFSLFLSLTTLTHPPVQESNMEDLYLTNVSKQHMCQY